MSLALILSWERLLSIIATVVTIVGGTITILWRVRTRHRRRLRMLKEYLEDREGSISERRQVVLAKVTDSRSEAPQPREPNVSKAVEDAIELLERHRVTAAREKLLELQSRITEKIEFLQRYNDDLARHQANVHLFLAAIANRQGDPQTGLSHISAAKAQLPKDADVLKYQGLLELKDRKWTNAIATFQALDDLATGIENRHYKAQAARGKGDALAALRKIDDALQTYDLALTRINQGEPKHRDPIFIGSTHLKMAELHDIAGNKDDVRYHAKKSAGRIPICE